MFSSNGRVLFTANKENKRRIHQVIYKLYVTQPACYHIQLSTMVQRDLKQASVSEIYSSHSTRSAATSRASAVGMSLSDICKAAGWPFSNTFGEFYKKAYKRKFGRMFIICILQ